MRKRVRSKEFKKQVAGLSASESEKDKNMPTLHWVGKNKVVNHHHEVPFRLLDKKYSFKANEGTPDNSTNNKIIHGDNLEALKSLLPEFEGKVNCIYIDPPYNTGNEGWVYNDNVNDPKIKKWLGQVVGKEGEDLSRHDKWLCMMYPRLKLLHRLLANDGVIFVSIDDNEQASLKLLMDEIFGASQFVANIIWHKKYSVANDHKSIAPVHDFILVYSKSSSWVRNLLPRKKVNDKQYNKIDSKGIWRADNYKCNKTAEERPNLYYPITNPNTGEEIWPKKTAVWRYSQDRHLENIENDLVYWGKDGKSSTPAFKRYKDDLKNAGLIVPSSLWHFDDVNHTDGARKELRSILSDVLERQDFATPKPSELIQRVLEVSTGKNSIVLDSFAGSGTTAHAVLKLNAQDGGNRCFILCEMMDYAETITAERIRRVINGYGQGNKAVAGTGGGFDFYTVGANLFKEDKNLNEEVGAEAIRGYVAYTENIPTGKRWDTENAVSPYALGSTDTALCVFYYEKDRVTTLDIDFLGTLKIKNLPSRPEQFVIYADKCALDKDFLYKHGITFKRIPRDITRF